MTIDELKIRRLGAQHLLSPVPYRTAVRDLCGMQAQFLRNAFHALRIRSDDFDETAPMGLMKSWTLRGTMHLFDEEDCALLLHQGRTHPLRACDKMGEDEWITRERKQQFAEIILKSIDAGIGDREELKRICAEEGMQESEEQSVFNPWGGMLRALCEAGKISHAVSEKKAFVPCAPFTPMEREAARLELARRYFTHYAPATVRDAATFFACPQAEVKRWLDALPVKATNCGEKTYYYIEETVVPNADMPRCIFLAGFDPLMMGYDKKENPFLPAEYLRGIYSLAGIVMRALLLDGRVVGRWKCAGRRLEVTLFEAIEAPRRSDIQAEADRLFLDAREVRFL